MLVNDPAAHGRQLVAPGVDRNCPALQSVHKAWPLEDVKRPAEQGVQDSVDGEWKVPARQIEQPAAPMGLIEPKGQFLQLDERGRSAKVPRTHCVQVVAAALENLPVGQTGQALWPVAGFMVPAAHATQSGAPAVE